MTCGRPTAECPSVGRRPALSASLKRDPIYIPVTAAILSLICIGVHYEALRLASSRLIVARIAPRLRVAIAVVVALVAHLSEVIVFAIGWSILLRTGVGLLSGGATDPEDIFYFSLITYTSLGYGDIVPLGPVRILAGVESLVGLVLIAWTASFTYLEMRRYWFDQDTGSRAIQTRPARRER